MPAGYPTLFFAYLAMLLVARRLSCRQFSPAVAFFFTWAGALGLLALGTVVSRFQTAPLSTAAQNYLLLAGLCVLAGTGLAHAFRRSRHRTAATIALPAVERYPSSLLLLIAATALLLTGIHVRQTIPDLGAFLAAAGNIRDELTDPTRQQTSVIATLASYAAMLVVPIAGLYWLRRRAVKAWMIMALVSAALLALATVGKFFFIFTGLTFINLSLYQQRLTRRKIPWRPLLAAGAVILLAFAAISALRDRRETPEDADRRTGLLDTLFAYATGYVPAFGSFYDEYREGNVTTAPTNPDYDLHDDRFGPQTFSGFYRLGVSLGLTTRSASNRYDGRFNVYTLYRDLIMDFGVAGSLGFIFLLGFGLTLLSRWLDRHQARHVVLLALLTTQMEFSLIYSLFGFVFYPVVVLFSPFLVSRTSRTGPASKLVNQPSPG